MIEVRDLVKTYSGGVRALRGVSLEIHPGRTQALVGESGCGKSTLARHLLGLERADSGQVLIEGRGIETYSAIDLAKCIQMVFQDPGSSLNPRRRIRDILAEPLIVHGLRDRRELANRVGAILERVGLSAAVADRYPHMFSGGQKQRLVIARALITGARYVLCDEPVSALDVSVQAQVLNLLMDLQRDFKLGCLFISHDLSVVRLVAQEVAVMYLGRIVEQGPAERVFSRPAHPYTRLLLESTPRFDQPPLEMDLGAQELPSPRDPPPGCSFHGRCRWAEDRCKTQDPALRETAHGRTACHLAERLDLSLP